MRYYPALYGGFAFTSLRTTRLTTQPQQETVSSSTVAECFVCVASELGSIGDGDELGSGCAAASLARALVAQRSSARGGRRPFVSSLDRADVGSFCSGGIVGVSAGDVVVTSVFSSLCLRRPVVVASGVSGKANARGVAGATPSACGRGENSKLKSPSSSSLTLSPDVPITGVSRSSISLTTLRSFGTNLSLSDPPLEPPAGSVGVVRLVSLPDPPLAPSFLFNSICSRLFCAATLAPYASYASTAAVPFFSMYA